MPKVNRMVVKGKVHICILDKECRENIRDFGMPPRVYLWNHYFDIPILSKWCERKFNYERL